MPDTDTENGVLDAAEFTAGPAASTTTNTSTGVWAMNLQPGSYGLCEVSQASWSQSVPNNAKCAAGAGLGGCFFSLSVAPRGLHSFPTRRSSDLGAVSGTKFEDQNGDGIIT